MQEKSTAAIDDLTAVIKLDPDYTEAYSKRGSIYLYMLAEDDKAIADLTKAISLDKTQGDLLRLGEAYTSKGDLPKAIAALDDAIALQPDFQLAFSARCYAKLLAGGRQESALGDCDKAIALKAPADDSSQFFRAVLLYQLKRYDAAWTQFDKVAKAVPDDPEARYGRGLAGAKLKRADAVADIVAAMKQDDEVPRIFIGYGISDTVNVDGAKN